MGGDVASQLLVIPLFHQLGLQGAIRAAHFFDQPEEGLLAVGEVSRGDFLLLCAHGEPTWLRAPMFLRALTTGPGGSNPTRGRYRWL